MAKEAFLVNPPRRGKGVKHRGFTIGREGSKHRPTVYTRGRRWRTSSKAKIAKPGRYLNPLAESLVTVGFNPKRGGRKMAYYRRRRNQAFARPFRQMMKVQTWVPQALTGGLAAVSGYALPAMVGAVQPMWKLGAQLASAFGGGMLVGQFAGKQHGQTWTIVGTSIIAYDLLKTWIPRWFPQVALGDYYYPDYEMTESQQVGAFPEEAVSDYPDYGGVQAFPNEVSDYPYDGQYAGYYS